MEKLNTWHIHIEGQVQGIGFRPYTYRLALKYKLKGWLNNSSNGVHIEFNATPLKAVQFYNELISSPPPLSFIILHSIESIADTFYDDFRIVASNKAATPSLLLSPDFALCKNCSIELKDKENRRYHYAFTTCTYCGPRYSIMNSLPYDRANTSMLSFEMCYACEAEYNDQTNRRYYSQTNSCPECPVGMQLYDHQQNSIEIAQDDIITKICELWSNGKIIALKGIGGFILTCAASDKMAIKQLRIRKQRSSKPFALMFPDIDSLQDVVYVNKKESKELLSMAAPIVLLNIKDTSFAQLPYHQIAPKLSKIGVMLPYAPLYQLLLQEFGRPIIASSGNVNNMPIISDNETALKELSSIADYILVHNRDIAAAQDDSLVTFSRYANHRIILRRARGLAPSFNNTKVSYPKHQTILAMGALLKSSFTLLHAQNIQISQYLGNTANYDAQQHYKKALNHFLNLFQTQPDTVLIDMHPDYFTSQLGKELAQQWSSKLVKVPHHEAHFAAVLGEYNLIDEKEPFLGVIWDGTGLGNDGQIWGGEFLTYHQYGIARVAHFEYFDSFLGDKMALEPRLSAFSLCHDLEEANPILKPKFTSLEWINYQKLIEANKLKTSSIGRLFDAVAALLGLIDLVTYEGEAAMLLEEQANAYFKNDLVIPEAWLSEDKLENPLATKELIKIIIDKINNGIERAEIAAWFHVKLTMAVKSIAKNQQCRKICFSGGVFQNSLLVDLMIEALSKDHQLYFNKELSPNDENISFGQVVWHSIQTTNKFQITYGLNYGLHQP